MVFHGFHNKKGLFQSRFKQFTKGDFSKTNIKNNVFATESTQLDSKQISLMPPWLKFRRNHEFRIQNPPGFQTFIWNSEAAKGASKNVLDTCRKPSSKVATLVRQGAQLGCPLIRAQRIYTTTAPGVPFGSLKPKETRVLQRSFKGPLKVPLKDLSKCLCQYFVLKN